MLLSLTGCQKKTSDPGTNAAPENQETATVPGDSTEETEAEVPDDYDWRTPALTRENFPRMDGSTSLAPLGTAVASKVLGESEEEVADLVSFNRTTQSYRNMMWGECDFILASEPNAVIFDEAKESGFEFDMEPISTEALVFVVNAENPVDNLTTDQIRGIYSGEITNWKEVGGEDRPIQAFQRNSGSGSQALMEKLVMQDLSMAEAPADYLIGSMGELMTAVRSYDNSADAIGYSVYYYANDMRMAEGLKIISIDGVMPEDSTIRKGEYPHTNAYYCVINHAEPEDSPARQLYDWMVSVPGQRLVSSLGYVSILDADLLGNAQIVSNLYTRKSPEKITELVPSGDYGHIYPFAGEILYSGENGYGGRAGYKYGMIDEKGCIILDPIYTKVEAAHEYDYTMKEDSFAPYWLMGQCTENPNSMYEEELYNWRYRVASFDGTFVSDKDFGFYRVGDCGLILADSYDADSFLVMDDKNQVIFNSEDMPWKDKMTNETVGWMSYSEGLFTLKLTDGVYYMDIQGNLVLGPYVEAGRFTQGRASATMDNEGAGYGIIDKNGKWLVPDGSYRGIGEYGQHPLVIAWSGSWDSSETAVILDLEGKVVHESSPSAFTYIFGDNFAEQNYETGDTVIYDATGKAVKELNLKDTNILERPGIAYTYTEGAGRIWDPLGDWSVDLKSDSVNVEGIFLHGSEDLSTNPMFLAVMNFGDKRSTDLYDPNTKKLLLENSTFIDMMIDPFTQTPWVYNTIRENVVEVMKADVEEGKDIQLTKTATYTTEPNIYNGLTMLTDDRSCQYIGEDGQVFFRYSLLQSLDD